MISVDAPATASRRLDRSRAGRVLIAIPLRYGLLLFLPAGTIAWTRGWIFVLVSLAASALVLACLWNVNRDVVIARIHNHLAGTKRWDKILLCFYLPSTLSILLVAALDDGRYHWFPTPGWVPVLGYVLYLLGFGLIAWSQAVNKFFEPTVRLQPERDQCVVDRGPYRIVRHPGYLAGHFIAVGTALSLGSLWALVPAAMAAMLLILRTKWEDATLQQELAGYKEFAARTRFRLIPGVW